MAAKVKETALVGWGLQALALRGYTCWRQNVGGAHLPGRGGKTQFVKFGRVGAADITGMTKTGRRLECEAKIWPNKQSDEQLAFQQLIERAGGVYLLFHTPQELIAKLVELEAGETA